MNVLVVGAAGFIGSHLTERLVAEGHAVDAIDNLSTGSLANLADARALNGVLKIHTIDAATDEFVTLVLNRQPEVIYHLGWLPPGRSGARTLGSTLQTVTNVAEGARQLGGVKVVLAAPAVSLYGEVPLRDLPLKEGHPFNPVGVVGVTALAALELCALYRREHAVEYTGLLMANVYGPRQRADGGVVAAFAEARSAGQPATIRGDGRQSRDLIFIDDVVDALVRAATKADGLVVNIGTGQATTIRDVWALVNGSHGIEPVAAPALGTDIARHALAGTRARIHLGWSPWTDLPTGIRSLR